MLHCSSILSPFICVGAEGSTFCRYDQSRPLPNMLSCLHEMSCANLLSQVPCEIAAIKDLLGTCSKDRSLLADLRYLQLLLSESSHLRKEICNLIEMRLKCSISPHVDLELQYHPITLALFQVSCAPLTTIVNICFFTVTACFWQPGCGYGYGVAASSDKAKSHLGIKQSLRYWINTQSFAQILPYSPFAT